MNLGEIDQAMRRLIAFAVDFELVAQGLDLPDAKYGTDPRGRPMHAPEWYVAHGIKTHFNESLSNALAKAVS
jgi:hypothetical protein